MPKTILFVLLIPLTIPVVYVFYKIYKNIKRKNIQKVETPKSWPIILQKNLSIYQNLNQETKEQLHQLIKVFIREKNFHGCGGLQLNEEIIVTIAAQACLLILNLKHDYYPHLKNIFIYPHAFRSIQKEHVGFIQNQKNVIRSGESWVYGPIVLSWSHALHGAKNSQDAQNVVYHEFAHQLDQQDGTSNGTPELPNAEDLKVWAHIMENGFQNLIKEVANNKKTLIDEYGATHPAEFFAVTTEIFFEKPNQLKKEHPDLYEIFKKYYKVDPALWHK